ncbi:hypothetical protein SK128_005055 [Halocaridina rubra]|uniref:Uncharacterized protein n=1 Tax=Halocaridina rubra TaxID=373956 RepID=A0AAN8X1X8_HALRR
MNWLWLSSNMMVTWKRAELEAKIRRDSARQGEVKKTLESSSSQDEETNECKKSK